MDFYGLQPSDVLLLDEALLVLNKPHGLPTRGRPGLPGEGLYEASLRELGLERLWLVHWLDRVTSGVLLFARSAAAAAALSAQFERREVRKTYLAWVEGSVPEPSGLVELPLTREGGRPRVDLEAGRPARTRYRLLRSVSAQGGAHARAALLWLRPHTGRTHQLRVHLAALGCPIVGDPVHGSGRPAPRCLLHAVELRLRHPLGGERLRLRAALRDGFSLDGPSCAALEQDGQKE